jgi:hypothetical protein
MIKKILSPTIKALFDDKIDRNLLISTALFYFTSLIIWKFLIEPKGLVFFWRTDVNPITFLSIILVINTILSIAAHDKEREVGYLLFMGNIIVCFLVLVLEMYYILI